MPRFKFLTQEETTFDPGPLPKIDTARKTALYVRQSGSKADTKHGESRETQLKLKDFAMRLRGDTDLSGVEVYDEKAGKSGTLDTHERPELQRLWNDIESGLIAVVIVARLDRLYRDDIGDQYGAFMRLAKEHNVIVIVPALKEGQQHKHYDLRDRDHRKAFRLEMEKAGSYIPEHIEYLHKCRRQKRAKGFYSGGNLLPGLIIDRYQDKETKKPIIYEPWAREMRKIFERAKELRWNFSLLIRELQEKPFIFPDIPEEDQKRYIFPFRLTKVENGYKARTETIHEWFTSLILAGHWPINKTQVKPNNHPAVIDPVLFEEGYIHATGEDLEGNIILEKKRAPKERAMREGEINLALRHILTCPQADTISNIKRACKDENRRWFEDDYMALRDETVNSYDTVILTLHGPEFDAIVKDRLIEWSEADNTLADRIKVEFNKAHEQQIQSLSSVKASLAEAQLQQARLETRMAKPTVTDTLYAQMEVELAGVMAKIGKLQADITAIEKIKGPGQIDRFYYILKNTRERYNKMDLQEKQTLFQILMESITVEVISPHWVKLVINWIAPVTNIPDIAYIWRRYGARGKEFSPEEIALLREIYPNQKADRYSDILPLFPDRTFYALSAYARKYLFAGNPCNIKRIADVPTSMTWSDLLAIPDQELSLAMAHEAAAACESIKGQKQGKQLYALWYAPVTINGMGGNSLTQITGLSEYKALSFESIRYTSQVDIWACVASIEKAVPDLLELLA